MLAFNRVLERKRESPVLWCTAIDWSRMKRNCNASHSLWIRPYPVFQPCHSLSTKICINRQIKTRTSSEVTLLGLPVAVKPLQIHKTTVTMWHSSLIPSARRQNGPLPWSINQQGLTITLPWWIHAGIFSFFISLSFSFSPSQLVFAPWVSPAISSEVNYWDMHTQKQLRAFSLSVSWVVLPCFWDSAGEFSPGVFPHGGTREA